MTGLTKIERPHYGATKTKLIESTLASIMEDGVEGCSARRISEHAGVAVGLINYHFSSIKDLAAAAYTQLAFDMLEPAVSKSESLGDDPRAQLSVFIETTFSAAVLKRRALRAWVVFWGMVEAEPLMRSAHDQTNAAFRDYVEGLFMKLEKRGRVKPSPRLAAIGLTAIVDGLWLEYCLQSRSFNRKEAVLLCEQWIDSVWQGKP